jgi:hypothetical protein
MSAREWLMGGEEELWGDGDGEGDGEEGVYVKLAK